MVANQIGFFCPQISKVTEVQFTDLLNLFDAQARQSIAQFDRVVSTEQINNARAMPETDVQQLKTEPGSIISSCNDEYLTRLTYQQFFLMSCERLANDCISALFSKGFIALSWQDGMRAISAPSVESSRLSP